MNRLIFRFLLALSVAFLCFVVIFLSSQPGNDKQKTGQEITNSIGMKLKYIAPGKFIMGSSEKEQKEALADYEKWTGEKPNQETIDWRRGEGPEREVEITIGFYFGVFEVTQQEYEEVMKKNPSHFSAIGAGRASVVGLDTDRFPVESVSYEDAVKFCETLSAQPKEKCAKRSYRLPTEAEWEYACRGGTKVKGGFHYGEALSSTQANFNGLFPYGGAEKSKFLERTCKVGSYDPNAFGLHDMHGNVWEWCSDWFDLGYYNTRPKPDRDPTGPAKPPVPLPGERYSHVLRGGSWQYFGRDCRSSRRNVLGNRPLLSNIGFRVLMIHKVK